MYDGDINPFLPHPEPVEGRALSPAPCFDKLNMRGVGFMRTTCFDKIEHFRPIAGAISLWPESLNRSNLFTGRIFEAEKPHTILRKKRPQDLFLYARTSENAMERKILNRPKPVKFA